ncbi:MAG: YggS family pyridoxal phosphate-dependent enzyme [Porticoccaceae bacterium]|nr:MAG: YggS family pyridoxal phosphate-dependent enzyme [Porticoccaceae bacterium]
MLNIADNLDHIHHRIQRITKIVGRISDDIVLLAVSKGQPAQAIRNAYELGQRHFGENYLQEALEKQQQLSDLTDICWHFIGPVQSNKTRKVAERFDWVHTVDRIKLAQRLSALRPESQAPINICLQVNINKEKSKSGLLAENVEDLAQSVLELPRVKLRGLMTIPQNNQTETGQHESFAAIAQLLTKLRNSSPQLATLDTLSMGMSADLEIAITEGATIIRVGTGIFGPRQTPQKIPEDNTDQLDS